MRSSTRSSLPIPPTILPTTILTAATQSNLSAQECQKSDTWLSRPVFFLLSLSLLPFHSPWLCPCLAKTHFTQLSCSLLAPCALCPLYNLLAQAACTELRLQVPRKKRNHSSPLPPPPSPLLAAIGGPLLLLLVSPLLPSLPGRTRLLPLPSRLLSPTPPNPPSHHAAIKDCSFLIPRIAFFTSLQLLRVNIHHSATTSPGGGMHVTTISTSIPEQKADI